MDSGLRRGFATVSTQYTPSFFDHRNYHFCLAYTQGGKGHKKHKKYEDKKTIITSKMNSNGLRARFCNVDPLV